MVVASPVASSSKQLRNLTVSLRAVENKKVKNKADSPFSSSRAVCAGLQSLSWLSIPSSKRPCPLSEERLEESASSPSSSFRRAPLLLVPSTSSRRHPLPSRAMPLPLAASSLATSSAFTTLSKWGGGVAAVLAIRKWSGGWRLPEELEGEEGQLTGKTYILVVRCAVSPTSRGSRRGGGGAVADLADEEVLTSLPLTRRVDSPLPVSPFSPSSPPAAPKS